ncbi:Bulb-type lectin domain [Sesbania bispinosa]|nr:Bulb-type lectin domain [Sesbania bispinosa]
MSKSTVIWVANRNQPLRDSPGAVTISENGNLVVLNALFGQQMFSVKYSNQSHCQTLRFWKTSRLVLLDNITGKTVWESFKHPSNTAIPTLKISKNVRTGEEVRITHGKAPLIHLMEAFLSVWKLVMSLNCSSRMAHVPFGGVVLGMAMSLLGHQT